MTTDRVIFKNGAQTISTQWEADWPPPPYLYLVEAREGLVLVNPDLQSEETLATLQVEHKAMLYVRQSASEVSKPAEPDANWFRGALYEPWRLGHVPG